MTAAMQPRAQASATLQAYAQSNPQEYQEFTGIIAPLGTPILGIALGIATYLAAWAVLMGLRVQRQGIDVEALKARFIPQTTIDTTKESIEWAKARVQRDPKS